MLELGSGVGLFGCAIAAVTDAAHVTLTDLDAVSDEDFDAPSGLLDAQKRYLCERVRARRLTTSTGRIPRVGSNRPTYCRVRIVYTHRKL